MSGTKTIAQPQSTSRPDAADGVAAAYREHGASVFRVALRFGRGNRAWAEDLTHEVFIALQEDWDAVVDPQRVWGWLYRATTRRCLNRLRRERLFERPWIRWLAAGWRAPSPDPERVTLGRETLDAVFAEVADLPDKQRVVFCMRHFDDKKLSEIAEVVGHSEGYISKLLARAEASAGLAVEREGA